MEDRFGTNKSVPSKYVTINDLRDQWLNNQQRPEDEEEENPEKEDVEDEEEEAEYPSKYVTILDLKERWLKQQRQKENERDQCKRKGGVEFNRNGEEVGNLENNMASFRRNVGKCGSSLNPNSIGEMGMGEGEERESLVNPNLGEEGERGREREFRRKPKKWESSVNPNLIGEKQLGRNLNWNNGGKPFRRSFHGENMATRNRVVKEDNSANEVSGINEDVESEPKIEVRGQLKGDGMEMISNNMRKKLWKERKRNRKASGETQKRNSWRDNSTYEMSEMKEEVGIEAEIDVSGQVKDDRKTMSDNVSKMLLTEMEGNLLNDGKTQKLNLETGKIILEEEGGKISGVSELNDVNEFDLEINGEAHLKNYWVADDEWKMMSKGMKHKLLNERKRNLLTSGEIRKHVFETGRRTAEKEGGKMSKDGLDNLNAEMSHITGLVNQIMVTEKGNVSENVKLGKKKMKMKMKKKKKKKKKKAGRIRDGTAENEARPRDVTVSGKQFPEIRTRYMLKQQYAVPVLKGKGIPVTENQNECGEEGGKVREKMSEDGVDNSTAVIKQITGLVNQIVVRENGDVSENVIRDGVIVSIVENVANVREVTASRKRFPEIKTSNMMKKVNAVPVSESQMRAEGSVLEKSIPVTENEVMMREVTVSGKEFPEIKTRDMLKKLNAVPVLEGKMREEGIVLEKSIPVTKCKTMVREVRVSGKPLPEIKIQEMPGKLNAVPILKTKIRGDGTVLGKSTTHVTHNSRRGEEGASVKRVREVRWADRRGRGNREVVVSVGGRWNEDVEGRIEERVYSGQGNQDKGLMWVKKS